MQLSSLGEQRLQSMLHFRGHEVPAARYRMEPHTCHPRCVQVCIPVYCMCGQPLTRYVSLFAALPPQHNTIGEGGALSTPDGRDQEDQRPPTRDGELCVPPLVGCMEVEEVEASEAKPPGAGHGLDLVALLRSQVDWAGRGKQVQDCGLLKTTSTPVF